MNDRCPTCNRQIEDDTRGVLKQNGLYQSLFKPRRSLWDRISQTITLFSGIAVGVWIGRGSAETTRTLIFGCIGFALFSIIIQTVSHKWVYRRET
jgi:hypothetical protein